MSASIKVGDLVTRTGDARPWRVVDVYPDLGFARLEFAGEAWVKSATADLDQIQLTTEITENTETKQEINSLLNSPGTARRVVAPGTARRVVALWLSSLCG